MNIHATAVQLGKIGFLIEGASGSGKTALALAAIADTQNRGAFAALAADDQCLVEALSGRLMASCPQALIDLVEIRGLGLVNFSETKHPGFSPIIVDAVIRLVDSAHIERMPDPHFAEIAGIQLPVFNLPARQIVICLPIIRQIIQSYRLKIAL